MAADFATRAIILTEVTEFIDSITTLVTEGEIKIDREDREEAGYLMNSSVYRLDESFSALQTALRRERNSTVLAARLPTEILFDVFLHAGIQTSFLATQVCHTWRIAALNYPLLWNKIDMNSKRYSRNLVQVQLEYSGSHPLDVTFSLTKQRYQIANGNLPSQPLDLITRASSISNLSTHTIPSMWTNPLPLLNSLHLVVDSSTPASNYVLAPCNLRHFSVDFGYHTLSFPKGVLSNLRTLHLRMIPEPASKVFAIVLNINGLRELVLDICNNKEDLSIEQINAMVRPLPLELLYLKEVALPFISCFVRPEMISKATNLRIEPCQQTSFQRPTPAGSVWIDLYHSYVLFEHGSGNGVTRVGVDNAYILAHTQTLVDYSHVTSLRWVGGPMKELPFQWLPSLRSLIFEYYPSIGSLQRQTLGDVIGSHLIASCPHLEYLGFTMTSDTHRSDGSEIELATFLQEWLGAHGKVFSEVQIRDGFRLQRWVGALDTLRKLTRSVKIKGRTLKENFLFPTFPDMRKFVVQEEDDSRPFLRGR